MPEAVVEFIDGNTVHYDDARAGNASRILTFYEDDKQIGFAPYEAIVHVSWKRTNESDVQPDPKASFQSHYEKQLLRAPSEEEVNAAREKMKKMKKRGDR